MKLTELRKSGKRKIKKLGKNPKSLSKKKKKGNKQ